MSKPAPFSLAREFDTPLNFNVFLVGAGWGFLLQLNLPLFSRELPVLAFVIVPALVMLTIGLFCSKLLHVVLAGIVYVLGQGFGSTAGMFMRTFAMLPSLVVFFTSMIGFTFTFWIMLLGFGVRRLLSKRAEPQPESED